MSVANLGNYVLSSVWDVRYAGDMGLLLNHLSLVLVRLLSLVLVRLMNLLLELLLQIGLLNSISLLESNSRVYNLCHRCSSDRFVDGGWALSRRLFLFHRHASFSAVKSCLFFVSHLFSSYVDEALDGFSSVLNQLFSLSL